MNTILIHLKRTLFALLVATQIVLAASISHAQSYEINFKQEYGHVDYMFSNKHLQELEHPILSWLLQQPFK